ncbi:MAG: NAD(P)/FAD-dependent oxidoreductase [Pseudomonadota bacterium]
MPSDVSRDTSVDAIVIGGSYAGLAASLQLARARRRVLVIDAGEPRNRFAKASHGFLGQDGRSPSTITEDARAQLLAYPTVIWRDGRASGAEGSIDAFSVSTTDGEHYEGRRLVIATGVVDHLPEIPGLRQRWGKTVVHCPYCHGYEFAGGPLGVLATSPLALHQALLVPDWGRTTLFLNGSFTPDDEQKAMLRRRDVTIVPGAVAAISGDDDVTVQLGDGRTTTVAGLFVASRTAPASPLAAQLGCAFTEGMLGPLVTTDEIKATSVPGVFACGDAALAMTSVSLAVADGAMAGVAAHRSLVMAAAGHV